MTTWTAGYVAELDYTHGYYRELAPEMMALAMLSGLKAERGGRPLRYLELGFGQGLSLNIHAAATGGEFWGTDFNPAQAANAAELARASGANLTVLDQSFADLARRDDLPEFDVIALHGIWSWISEANRAVIVEIARRHLAVGGILYVSYNATPGWSAAIPLRHLMTLHLELASGEAQGLAGRIGDAVDFAQRVVDSNALYFRANPQVAERLRAIKGQNRNYVAHEFFNADWHPMPFSAVAGLLEGAKLSFAVSSNLLAHVDALNLTAAQQQLMAGIAHPVLRESVRDYCENQQFRRDIFVKGPRALSQPRQLELFMARRFVLTSAPKDVPQKATGPAGEATLQPAIYQPVLAALAAHGHAPKSLAEVREHPDLRAVAPAQIIQAVTVLAGLGHVQPVQDDDARARARESTSALNAHLVARAVHSSDCNHLASPVTGAGVAVGRVQQLFLRALARGKATAQEQALDVWPILEAQGQRLMREGKPIATAVENIGELAGMAQEFQSNRMPILRALGVTPESPAAATASAPGRPIAAA